MSGTARSGAAAARPAAGTKRAAVDSATAPSSEPTPKRPASASERAGADDDVEAVDLTETPARSPSSPSPSSRASARPERRTAAAEVVDLTQTRDTAPAPASLPPSSRASHALPVSATKRPAAAKVCVYFEGETRRTSTTCTLLPCGVDGCPATVCEEHGHGIGQLEGDGEYAYDERRCLAADCPVVYCARHFAANTRECEVCRRSNRAQASLGMYNSLAAFPYCRAHWSLLRHCEKREDDWLDEFRPAKEAARATERDSDGEEEEEEDDEDDDGEACGLLCCPECIEYHDEWHNAEQYDMY